MNIREATTEDLEGILRLAKKLLDFHSDIDKYYSIYSQYEDSGEFYKKQLKNDNMCFFIAENNKGETVGFVSCSVTKLSEPKAPAIGNLISIFVEKEYRNQGLGKKLLDTATEWLKEKGAMHIEASIDAHNNKVLDLMKKRGFRNYQHRLKVDL